jgi:hypothetical protein
MTLEEKLELEIWLVLQQLKKESILSGDIFWFKKIWSLTNYLSNEDLFVSYKTVLQILESFNREGVIKFEQIENQRAINMDGSKVYDSQITILQPKFNQKYKESEEKSFLINNKIKQYSKIVICINENGISLKDSPLKRYEVSGKRFDTIKKIQNEKSCKLEELSSYNNQDDKATSRAIKEINKNFKEKLKFTEESPNLITHSKTRGFYLNDENYIFENNLE